MKIPILYSPSNSKDKLSPYIELFFEYLQEDKGFEKLIETVRINVSNYIGNIKSPKSKTKLKQYPSDQLDIVVQIKKSLRSDNHKIKREKPEIISSNTKSLITELDKQTNIIFDEYPFLKNWHQGLRSFILRGRFIVSDDNSNIKLRVRNNNYRLGMFEDNNEEGVKVVITSKVSKRDLKNWIDDNYTTIVYYLRSLSNLSYKDSRRNNYERDKLIFYLRTKLKMTYREIADIVEEKTDVALSENAIEKAFKDFPLHYPSLVV